MSARASDFPSEAQYSVFQNTRWPRFVETLRSTCLVHVETKHVAWNVAWFILRTRLSAHLFFLSFRPFFCHRQYSISGRQRAGGQDLVWQLWATIPSTTSSEPVNQRWRPHTQGSVTLVDIDSHTGQDSSPQGETCCLTGGFSFAPPQPPSRVAQ